MPDKIIDTETLRDFDMFFYYGQNDLELETRHDILVNLKQPKRSLFYDRCLDSAGIDDYENKPDGLTIQALLPYDIVNSISTRNQYVSNGENEAPDRRVAISQSLITFNSLGPGAVSVTVLFILLANLKQADVMAGLGVGKV